MLAYALANNDDSTWVIVLLLALVCLVLAKLASDNSKKAKSERGRKAEVTEAEQLIGMPPSAGFSKYETIIDYPYRWAIRGYDGASRYRLGYNQKKYADKSD